MNSNNFLKHFFIIGSGTILNMLLGVLTTPLITRYVSPISYGQFSIFTMYSNIALMILGLGLDQALVRFFYENESLSYKRRLLFRCIKLPIIAGSIISVNLIILSLLRVIQFEFSSIITIILCIYTMVQLVYRFSQLLVRLSYKSKLYSELNIINKLLYIVIALPLLIFTNVNDLFTLVIAISTSAAICMIISIVAEKDIWNIKKFKQNKNTFNISNKVLIKYAYPYVFSMGITAFFQAIDKISLNMYRSYSEVGIYSSTMSLVNLFAIIQTTFNSLWGPISVEHYTKNNTDKFFYQKTNQLITVIMFFAGISLILCKDVFAILLGKEYREAAYILPFLIFHPIMYTISETTVCGLVFMKKSKLQVVVVACACIFNIIGNTILVPEYGCKGAAISTGISYIIFFTLRTLLSNKYFYIDFKLKKFYFLTGVVCVYALYNTFVEFNIGSIIGYIICLVIMCLLYHQAIKLGGRYLRNLLQNVWGSFR